MAVTFTLDLRALLAAPAAFALAGHDNLASDGSQHEPIELLHALRSHAGKITVFSQVGEIALPPSRRVFAFLERAVVPVVAPRGGVVHPKVWVLRYEAVDKPIDSQPREQRLRVLIASRNLTFDTSWDTVVRLDEARDSTGALLEPVGDLFEGLLDAAVSDVSVDHRQRVHSLSAALQTAKFALPVGVDHLETHVLGLSRKPSPLPASAERSLIISPFVSDDFFQRVRPAPIDELVSRAESLDHLGPGALDKVAKVYTFDDGSAVDLATEAERSSPHDPGRPLVGLHAKVFAFEDRGRARLFVGSANATGAAFNSNVEILVELTGPAAVLGIDKLCNGTMDEPSLRDLFNTYRPDPPTDPPEAASLDSARCAIARLPIEGIVEESGTGWAVTYQSRKPLPFLDSTEIHCWPLASAGNRRRVATGEPLEARFETSLETISGFLAFELAHEDGTLTFFVVPVPLVGVPEHRERFLLRALVGNAERFLRYLLALLNEDSGQMDLLDAVNGAGEDTADGGNGPLNLPVLEKLLKTMRRDPAKLAGLHPLVTDLAADDALPPGFAELWTMIYDVAIEGAVAR
ncbi:MAG: phospholipase D family protein [bacterium]|nr:phospholipase D family protein [bacterium]